MSKKQNNKLEQFTFKGIITGTSNKQSEDFKNDNPRKSCYIKVRPEVEKALIEQGLTKYTSENKEDFFVMKLSEKLTVWIGQESEEMDTSINSENFFTEKEILFACIKGRNKGNDYVRIFAVGVKSPDDIIINEKENPFRNIEGFLPIESEDIPF